MKDKLLLNMSIKKCLIEVDECYNTCDDLKPIISLSVIVINYNLWKFVSFSTLKRPAFRLLHTWCIVHVTMLIIVCPWESCTSLRSGPLLFSEVHYTGVLGCGLVILESRFVCTVFSISFCWMTKSYATVIWHGLEGFFITVIMMISTVYSKQRMKTEPNRCWVAII